MPEAKWSAPTRRPLPLILIRGFGGFGIEDEKRIAYQGFNDGTVYPKKRGDNYIYEGMIIKFMKSAWLYQDATNVVGYFPTPVVDPSALPHSLRDLPDDFFYQPAGSDASVQPLYKVVIDPGMALTIRDRQKTRDPARTLWVFRYYDLNDRTFQLYGRVLVRLIDFIRGLASDGTGFDRVVPKVNIIAHSMGGLIVREAIQRSYPESGRSADEYINKVVTLGTPHRGIAFQVLSHWIGIEAKGELECFSPEFQQDPANPVAYTKLGDHFDLRRFLTVIGTNYKAYGVKVSTWANRLFSVADEFGPSYNRSDGLVKQTYAQVPGAPRTFVHKCHGGDDSLVTSREAFEISTRFFFGNLRVRLRMLDGRITRGKDFFGKSEFFFGVSVKPRRVDFDLFHQSVEAENCYGPFTATDEAGAVNFSEPLEKLAFGWADDQRLIWEGYLDTSQVMPDPSTGVRDMVFRLDFYVGERDLFGIGFSDNVVFRKQYYLRTLINEVPPELYLLTNESFMADNRPPGTTTVVPAGWAFDVGGTGFQGTFQVEFDIVPEDGEPVPMETAKPPADT
jgi:PGAP1-like protein